MLRPRGGRDLAAFEVGHGDLLVHGGSCQRTWEHAVPKDVSRSGRGSACSSAARGYAEAEAHRCRANMGTGAGSRRPGPGTAPVFRD